MFQMYLVFGGRISLLFFIGVLASNCTVNKKPQTTFDNYIKDQNFNDRLSNYMLDIDELAKYGVGENVECELKFLADGLSNIIK